MKVYGGLDLQQNYLSRAALPLDTDFPDTPVVGQLLFKEGVVYICLSVVDGLPIWCPLTQQITTYTHAQTVASKTWNISHGLNTAGVFVTVYDADNKAVIPNEVQITGNNTVTVSFGTEAVGRAVVLSGSIGSTVAAPPAVNYTIEFSQTTPATTWTITHNLGRNPIARVFIDNQEVQPASITMANANTVVVAFTNPQVGSVKLV